MVLLSLLLPLSLLVLLVLSSMLIMSAMSETQTQRPFLSDCETHMSNTSSPVASFFRSLGLLDSAQIRGGKSGEGDECIRRPGFVVHHIIP